MANAGVDFLDSIKGRGCEVFLEGELYAIALVPGEEHFANCLVETFQRVDGAKCTAFVTTDVQNSRHCLVLDESARSTLELMTSSPT